MKSNPNLFFVWLLILLGFVSGMGFGLSFPPREFSTSAAT